MKPASRISASVAATIPARQLEVRYVAGVPAPKTAPLRTPALVADVLRPIMADRDREVLLVLHLDARHRLIGWEVAAVGGANVVHVSPRDIFRSALAVGGAAIIVAHNHPSGDPTPSPEDVALTDRLRAAAELVGVPLLDHLVVADEGFFSFTDARITRPPREASAA